MKEKIMVGLDTIIAIDKYQYCLNIILRKINFFQNKKTASEI